MILGIIQARLSSTRLPGKVLKPILGVPMILYQIERVKKAKSLDHLLLATSQDTSDDPLGEICRENGIDCFRGSLEDVLDRFYLAAKSLGTRPEHVVRLTGDCPLSDPEIIDRVVEYHVNGGYDYTNNTLEPTYPDGLDVEIIRFSCLEYAWREAKLKSQREHVTPFIYQNPQLFKIGIVKHDLDLSAMRWTVDEPEDLEFVTVIYENLYPKNKYFSMKEILEFIGNHPDITKKNERFQRNEGFLKSLKNDGRI